jgi:isopropylmalate/homocitrate/citramalate synthase
MDGFRSDPDFINQLIDLVDADQFGISDTVGARNPWEVERFLDQLDCDLSEIRVHFHHDLGLGTANAMAAVRRGVGKVDVTCGGIGERVGNVALEELIVALELSETDVDHTIDIEELIPSVKSVLDTLDEDVSDRKPIVGEAAYEHESGMHTAEMIDVPSTFEPFDPARFGGERRLLFGSTSGRGAARRLLQEANVKPTEENVTEFLDVLHSLDENATFKQAVVLAEETF